MPGETVLPVAQYPDDFQIVTFSVDVGTSTLVPLMLADRDLILDQAWVRYEAANTAGLTGTLVRADDGVALAAANGTTLVTLTSDTVNFNSTAATKFGWTLIATENLIASGKLVGLVFSGAANASLGVVTVTLRVRSRRQ